MSITSTEAADLFRGEPDRYLEVGAGAVAHRRVGSGPDVLFVHGWPVSGATFRTLLHIHSVRRVVDLLELDAVAVVGHDSGGLIARHALAGDPRLRAMGLINTEQPRGLSPRFRSFLAVRHLPGLAAGLGWVAGRKRLRRNPFVLGGAFADRSLLDGEFDEFFLRPLRELPLAWAKEMVGTFPDAGLTVVEGAGLFSHEERPDEVAHALLPTLLGQPVA